MGSSPHPLPLGHSSFARHSNTPPPPAIRYFFSFSRAAASQSLRKMNSSNVGCVSAPFKALRLRSIQNPAVESVKASTSGFTPPSEGDGIVDVMLEGSEAETTSPGTSFLAKLAIALGIAATITLICVCGR